MMEFMVRVSRAWWHSGDVVIEAATEEEALDAYRRVRDEIRRFVETLPEVLEK